MKDWNAVRHNERLKLLSQALIGAGVALIGWAGAFVWEKQTFIHPKMGWVTVGVMLVLIAVSILGLIKPEE